jgi:hypothetical protein
MIRHTAGKPKQGRIETTTTTRDILTPDLMWFWFDPSSLLFPRHNDEKDSEGKGTPSSLYLHKRIILSLLFPSLEDSQRHKRMTHEPLPVLLFKLLLASFGISFKNVPLLFRARKASVGFQCFYGM